MGNSNASGLNKPINGEPKKSRTNVIYKNWSNTLCQKKTMILSHDQITFETSQTSLHPHNPCHLSNPPFIPFYINEISTFKVIQYIRVSRRIRFGLIFYKQYDYPSGINPMVKCKKNNWLYGFLNRI